MSEMRVFTSKRVLLGDNLEEAGIVVGREGRINRIIKGDELKAFLVGFKGEVLDAGHHVISPGVVDSHVHINEPGRTQWEGFYTATRSAAAGGVTTVVDMPLNSIPPTTTVDNLNEKLSATQEQLHVDVAFWGGVIPGNQDDLLPLIDAGVVGFKCFLCPSGVDEFPHVTRGDVERALEKLQQADSVLAFHAECSTEDVVLDPKDQPEDYSTFLKSRPESMEVEAITLVADLCTKYKVRCHIVHLSAGCALPVLLTARSRGAQLTAETCHHYLTLTSEHVPRHAVQYKCCPPVRGADNKELLWEAVKAGHIDMVVSDHSPCTSELKRPKNSNGDFMSAWGGIASLQFGLSLFWTEAKNRGLQLADVARLLSHNTARLVGLDKVKGRLEVGMDADLVIWDPEESFIVEESIIEHKNKLTPYLGRRLYGKVYRTVVRGETVYLRGSDFPKPTGKILLKNQIK